MRPAPQNSRLYIRFHDDLADRLAAEATGLGLTRAELFRTILEDRYGVKGARNKYRIRSDQRAGAASGG